MNQLPDETPIVYVVLRLRGPNNGAPTTTTSEKMSQNWAGIQSVDSKEAQIAVEYMPARYCRDCSRFYVRNLSTPEGACSAKIGIVEASRERDVPANGTGYCYEFERKVTK